MGRRDKIHYTSTEDMEDAEFNKIPEIYLINDNKDNFYSKAYSIYDVAFSDLENVEKRLYKTICFYIDQYEKINRVKDYYTIIDRFVMSNDIIECELKYQFSKLRMAEQYLLIYEHINDPLECYRLNQKIMTIIDKPPILDFTYNYFKNSYQINTIKNQKETILLKKLIKF